MASLKKERVSKAVMFRPRCMICNAPIPYGTPGINYRVATCSLDCSTKRRNWFVRPTGRRHYKRKGPPTPEFRQENARKAALARWAKASAAEDGGKNGRAMLR